MKTKLLLLLLLANFSIYAQQYTAIPDINFEKKLIALGYDTAPEDGQVLTANISGVTTLELSYLSITDLTGIEDFTALTILKTYGNPLTTVDISKNLALKEIRFDGLRQSSLNLSSNINLEKIWLVRTLLSAIDVTSNVNLKELTISSGGSNSGQEGSGLITSLDLSHNPNLIVFECTGQKLPNFDFSSHPLLETISFEDTKATSFDFSHNIALKDLSIDNSFLLESIDLSNNINLRELSISDTKIVNLDLSNNPAIGLLRCTDANYLETINLKNGNNSAITPSYLYLKETPSLHCVLVDDVSLSETNWSASKESWLHFSSVCETPKYTLIPDVEFEKALMLHGFDGVLDGKVLTSVIANVKELDYKYSNYSQISDLTGIEDFASLEKLNTPPHDLEKLNVSKNIALKTLNCSGSKLNALDVSNNINLVSLDCSFNNLTTINVKNNIALNELNVGINQLTDIDVSENKTLVKLIVFNNNFTSIDLSKNTNLNYVDSRNSYQLKCIQVADVDFALANWTIYKDANTNYNLDCTVYTVIPDANFEQKLIDLGIDKDGKNGKVATKNIASLTSLNVSKSAITDLTGIQDFTSLTQLSVSENLLTNLDLSNNINLEGLQASKNQLTTLNVSKNTALTDLSCSSNKLTALDVSTLTSLTDLTCSSNNLTTLDVDNNPALYFLNCGYNQLTAINVSKNTALINFYCHANKITSLDVSNNIRLEYFMCHDNQLTAINVSKNTELVMFDCLDNQLTSVDISNNPKITELACENNKLVSLNLKNGANINLDLAFTNFKNNPDLKCIQVDDVNYANTNWSAIKDASAEFNTDCRVFTLIPDVNFEDKLIALNIDTDGKNGKVLTEDIASIITLDLSNSSISDLTGIQDFAALETLNCSTNLLTNLDLSSNKKLTVLNCSANQLTNLNSVENSLLTDLNCSSNLITALDLTANKKLTVLNCSTNQLTALDIAALPLLTSLNCSYNTITSLDITANPALITIDFSNNALNSLNLKNGFNTNLDWFNVNFTKNPALSCIQVDNAQYSNDNWNGKLDQTSYFTEDCTAFTLIPDSNFEDKLIELKIDIDGKNGKVLTSSISKVTDLNVQLSEISDLTGIEGFTALEYLNCQFNTLSSLNLSQNSKLIELYCHGNTLTALDLQTNTELTTLQCNKNQIAGLDVSKNAKLVYINVMENALTSLSLKNGNNTNFQGALLAKNPTLSCIQVDNADFANTNTNIFFKDETANYSEDCNAFTLIPDANFEQKLIDLGIDSDGKNGKVQTASINHITNLDLSSSNISSLIGIQDFAALISLDCNFNNISTIDISQNKLLTKFTIHENKLTSLDVAANTELFNLTFSMNQISTIDLSQNKKLHYVIADRNLLTNLNVDVNTELETIYCGENKLTSLNLSTLSNLTFLECSHNDIAILDLTSNTKLNGLYCDNMKLTTLNLTKNPLLKSLQASWNQLTTLDLSQNPNLELVFLEFNSLTSLNVQNGNNTNFILPSQTGKKTGATYTSFLGNKLLNCIKVDDPAYSNANWSKIKEETTIYSATCTLGVEESVFDKVVVYPNPTKGEVNINNIALEKVTVYNTIGQLVKTMILNSGNTDNAIDLSDLPKGVYFIYLINEDAASAKKIILE